MAGKIICEKENYDGRKLWKVGEVTTEDSLATKSAKKYFSKAGGSPEDLLSDVEKETEGTEKTGKKKAE